MGNIGGFQNQIGIYFTEQIFSLTKDEEKLGYKNISGVHPTILKTTPQTISYQETEEMDEAGRRTYNIEITASIPTRNQETETLLRTLPVKKFLLVLFPISGAPILVGNWERKEFPSFLSGRTISNDYSTNRTDLTFRLQASEPSCNLGNTEILQA